MKRHRPFKPDGESYRYAFAVDLMDRESKVVAAKAVAKITTLEDARVLVAEDIEKAKDKKKAYQQVWSLVFPVASKEFATLRYKGIPVCVFYARRIVTEHVDVLVPIRESAQIAPSAWVVISLLGKEMGSGAALKERLKKEEERNKHLQKAADRLDDSIGILETEIVQLKMRLQDVAVYLWRTLPDDTGLDTKDGGASDGGASNPLESPKLFRLLGVHTFYPREGTKPKPDECMVMANIPSRRQVGVVAACVRPALMSEDDVLVKAEVNVFSELKKSSKKRKGKKHA
jgi:hypothetical protein